MVRSPKAAEPPAEPQLPHRVARKVPVFREGDHVERAPDGTLRLREEPGEQRRPPLTLGPRAFAVTVRHTLFPHEIAAGDTVSIDPDAPLASGRLVLAVLDTNTERPWVTLATYRAGSTPQPDAPRFRFGPVPPWLDVAESDQPVSVPHRCDGFRVIGPAVAIYRDVARRSRSNVAAIEGAPPELEIPEPDQPPA